MRRTILHPRSLQPITPVGYRKDGRPIWPILGGSEPPNPPPNDPPSPPPNNPPADPPNPPDRGFPEGTPLEQMSVEQREAYWRHHARKHESTVKARADYDEIKAKAAEFDQLKASQATDQEKAVNAAREEGRTEATRIANEKAVKAILRGALTAKGKSGDELTTLVEAANPAAFMTDGEADADKVAAYVASIAGAGTTQPVDTGQGRRTQTTGSGLSAGRDRYEQRRGKKATANA